MGLGEVIGTDLPIPTVIVGRAEESSRRIQAVVVRSDEVEVVSIDLLTRNPNCFIEGPGAWGPVPELGRLRAYAHSQQ